MKISLKNIKLMNGVIYLVDRHPNECPYCHHKQHSQFMSALQSKSMTSEKSIVSIWRCTFEDCESVFVVEYLESRPGDKIVYEMNRFWESELDVEVDPSVRSISPDFVEIYRQSLEAENNNYDKISGCGLRKAVEYLARDYAIYLNAKAIEADPTKKEKLESAPLANLIDQQFGEDVKELFHRGTWIGGDEVHYKKKYDGFTIDDLKGIIALIMHEIQRMELKKKYLKIEKSTG